MIFFSKAVRRIGRVADYIGKYRHGIINKGEMNRVQQYLGKQCNILSSKRSIVRRGLMIRRTTGWAARNKNYHFFLFNDVLLWTTKTGFLQNVVQLKYGELLPSESKTNVERKFRMDIITGQKTKTLLLECISERQRDCWYNALANAIKKAKESTEVVPMPEIINFNAESDSDEEVLESIKNKMLIKRDSFVKVKITRDNISEDRGTVSETSTPVWNGTYPAYEAHSFITQNLSEFSLMDDVESQISEQDQSYVDRFGQDLSKTSSFSPHNRKSLAKISGESGNVKETYSPRGSLIKRTSESITKKPSDDLEVTRSASFTFRLNDSTSKPADDLVIHLEGLDDRNEK